MSQITKLSILAAMFLLAIGLYMYLIYSEISKLQLEAQHIENKFNTIQNQFQSVMAAHNLKNADTTTTPLEPYDAKPSLPSVIYEDDDNVSVTSNEIKELLTNIQDDDEHRQEAASSSHELNQPSDIDTTPSDEGIASFDFMKATEDELKTLKYEDIRNYLRQQGMNAKGSKSQYIARIIAMQKA